MKSISFKNSIRLFAVVVFAGAVIFLSGCKREEGKEVKISDVPPNVKATIMEYAKDFKIKEIEKVTKDGKTFYVVEIRKKIEFIVAEDGKYLGEEKGKERKDKKEHKDKD